MNVDLIIPVYNQAKYLPVAIESALNDGLSNKSIYLIDDSSFDDPEKIAIKYHINYLRNPENLGPAAARNIGIKNSSSELIAFLDADDAIIPGRLRFSINSIMSNDAGMVCGNYKFWVNRLNITKPFYSSPIQISYENMIKNNYVACGSVMIKRSVVSELGYFNQKYRLAEDYDLWIRVVEKYRINYIHHPLYLYHRDTINKKSLTSNPSNLSELINNVNEIKKLSLERKNP